MHVKIKIAEIFSDEEKLVATLMLMKDLKKNRKRKAPFAWVRNLYKALTICLLGKWNWVIENTTSGELLN